MEQKKSYRTALYARVSSVDQSPERHRQHYCPPMAKG
jgi:predicted site-specific integrase-resolvase